MVIIMYAQSSFAAAPLLGGATALAYTGVGNVFWLVIAAFALLAVGGALLRIAPSLHTAPVLRRHATASPLPTVRVRAQQA